MNEPAAIGSPTFGQRLRLGWREAGHCWRLLADDPSLLILPSFSVLFFSSTWVALYLLTSLVAEGFTVRMLLVGLVGAYPYAFAGTFFGVAFVAVADGRLRGRPTSIRDGLRIARGKSRAIAKWSLLASGVGLILQLLSQIKSEWLVTPIVSWIAGVGWTVVTFFVIPVLAFEELSVRDTLRRSTTVIRGRWGEGVGGFTNIAVVAGTGAFVLSIAAAIMIGIAFSISLATGIVAAAAVALIFLASIAALDAAGRLLALALYRYATDGAVIGGFTAAELSGAVRRKRRWR